jgi:hypothetical protein
LDDLPAVGRKNEPQHLRLSRQPRFILSNLIAFRACVNRRGKFLTGQFPNTPPSALILARNFPTPFLGRVSPVEASQTMRRSATASQAGERPTSYVTKALFISTAHPSLNVGRVLLRRSQTD